MSPVRIFYTGDLITPDGSDTDGYYGEPVEEGTGFTYATGWVDPDWSRRDVYDNRDDVRADEFDPADGVPLIEWLADRLESRLNGIDDLAGSTRTFYAADSDADPYTGVSLRMAAHVDGVADNIMHAVVLEIQHRDRVRDRAAREYMARAYGVPA